jgi:hypothetical protein
MYEITHRGAWFNWKALDHHDKMLAGLSLAATIPPSLITGLVGAHFGYRLGFEAGSGGAQSASSGLEPLFASDWWPAAVLLATLCAIVSGIAWWRFSVRQDEMFNRIQNHAIGAASAWTMGLVTLWWLLSLGRWTGTPSLTVLVLLHIVLLCGFWFHAVRKWAS